ncbi:MAG: TolC family protein [Rickettsiales bacterium]|nr:TolC family protein [Rickettsiales bacterium]
MRFFLLNIISFLALFFLSFESANAKVLQLEEVLSSSIKNYPKILEAQEKIKQKQGEVLSKEGYFDLEFNQNLFSKASGFYDGRVVDSKLEKRIPEFGSKIYTGYKISDGNFPIYEDQFNTNENGEYSVGLMFSLLRDRAIDSPRFNLISSQLALQQAEFEKLFTQVTIQYKSFNAYYNWVSAGLIYYVYKNLLEIAEKRQSAFEERVKRGDLAKIFLTENRQNILKRKSQLVEAERILNNQAFELSLFYRDKNGNPVTPSKENLPKNFQEINFEKTKKADFDFAKIRPDIKILISEIEIQRNKILIGENSINPRFDIAVEASKDRGAGSASLAEDEANIMAKVSIPLQRRLGQGQIDEARASISQLEKQKQLLLDNINAEISSIQVDLEANTEKQKITEEEVLLAKKMEQAEIKRFSNGASDFFVVNMREEKTAIAKINNILAKLDYLKSISRYYSTTIQLDKFQIN